MIEYNHEKLREKIKLLGELWCGYCGRFIHIDTLEEYMAHLDRCEYYSVRNRKKMC